MRRHLFISVGTKGLRVRLPGASWVRVDHEMWMRLTTADERDIMRRLWCATMRCAPRIRRAEVTHHRTVAEVIDGDVVRAVCDVYVTVHEDQLHGRLRCRGAVLSEDEAAVTMWMRPRGHGWIPWFGDLRSTALEELGWVDACWVMPPYKEGFGQHMERYKYPMCDTERAGMDTETEHEDAP